MDDLVEPQSTCSVLAHLNPFEKESYTYSFSASEDSLVLFDESFKSHSTGVSPTTWSKSLASKLIDNGYDTF